MIDISQKEIWFVVGSQELYGEETLRQVAEHSQEIAKGLDASLILPVKIVYKDIVKSPSQITMYVWQRIRTKIVLVLLLGCILFHLQKCGLVV